MRLVLVRRSTHVRYTALALVGLGALVSVLDAPLAAVALVDSSVSFTHGVASGDVTPVSAVVWTRTSGDANVTIEVARDPAFGPPVLHQLVTSQAANDFAVKSLVGPLVPSTAYWYRFRAGSSVSEVGSFKTAPSPLAVQNLRFVWTADSDGTRLASGAPAFNNFETFDAARSEAPDFFVYLGDTIYSDSFFRAPATTLGDYRGAYKVNREYPALRNLLRSTSSYAQWDDHEVYDNFAGQTVDPSRFAAGRQAFLDYMPMSPLPLPRDTTCAAPPLFRAFKWGQAVDLFIPDERSCRSPQVDDVRVPNPSTCNGDFAPTLPTFIRAQFSSFFPPLAAGCLAAINDPSRTMLGATQKQLLEQGLLHSTARLKVIVSEVAIQQEYVDPYDRWEGYAAERAEILNFIRANHISNVMFLSADDHVNLINDVLIDRVTDSTPIASEFVTGPVASFTGQQIVLAFLGPQLGPLAVAADQQILSFAGVRCRNLDKYSYGVVDVDAAAGTATVTLKDAGGNIVLDQVDPNIRCTRTIGL